MLRLEVFLSLLAGLSLALGSHDLLDRFLALDIERERFLASDGKLGHRCGNRNPCVEGLECTPSVGRKVCLPKKCAEEAFLEEYQEKNNLNAYQAMILEKAGIAEGEDIFNHTTMKLGEDVLSDEGIKYIIRKDARDAIVKAMRENPLDLSTFMKKGQGCIAGKQDPSEDGITGLGGFFFQFSAAFKFFNSFYFVRGSSDSAGSIYTDICFGGGPDIGFSFGGLGGLGFTGTKEDLDRCSVVYGAGVFPVVGAGFANAYTIPGCVGQLEFYLGAGLQVGAGLSFCITNELDNYEDGNETLANAWN